MTNQQGMAVSEESLSMWKETNVKRLDAFYDYAMKDTFILSEQLPWRDIISETRDILEVGCGFGLLIKLLLKQKILKPNISYSAIDASQDVLDKLQTELGAKLTLSEFICSDYRTCEFSKADLVFAANSLHTTPEVELKPLIETMLEAANKRLIIAAFAQDGFYEKLSAGVRGVEQYYTCAETIEAALQAMTLQYEKRENYYMHRVEEMSELLIDYLAHSALLPELTLDACKPILAEYLKGGFYEFKQHLVSFEVKVS